MSEETCYVQSSLLSSYFHRIFYNADDLFLFKKRFTTYHAANSFFSYAFNQTEFQALSSLSFCKGTGRISFSDPSQTRLRPNPKPPQLFRSSTMEQIEANDFEGESRSMPFRLTSNIVEFIGQTGLHGLFAGAMTACSMAIAQHAEKLQCFLVLALKDELIAAQAANPTPPASGPPQAAPPGSAIDPFAQQASCNADFTMFKIRSLSNHKQVIYIDRSNRELERERLMDEDNGDGKKHEHQGLWTTVGNTRIPSHMLDLQVPKPDMPEAFNKKVFYLIDLAMDDSRKRQMPVLWCPWF